MTAARDVANWLCLAASPTFAMMALMTGILGGGPMAMLCGAAQGPALGGMVPMYLLMSAFHLAPWLKLIARRYDQFSTRTASSTMAVSGSRSGRVRPTLSSNAPWMVSPGPNSARAGAAERGGGRCGAGAVTR